MKKLLTLIVLVFTCSSVYSQHHVFMGLLQDRIISNREDMTNYLVESSFIQHGTTFDKDYTALNTTTRDYKVSINTERDGYIIYKTNQISEYNSIKRTVNEMTTNGNHCYFHRCDNINDVDVLFMGFNTRYLLGVATAKK